MKCIKCIRDKATGECYDIKDAVAREQIEEQDQRIKDLENSSGSPTGDYYEKVEGVDFVRRNSSQTTSVENGRVTCQSPYGLIGQIEPMGFTSYRKESSTRSQRTTVTVKPNVPEGHAEYEVYLPHKAGTLSLQLYRHEFIVVYGGRLEFSIISTRPTKYTDLRDLPVSRFLGTCMHAGGSQWYENGMCTFDDMYEEGELYILCWAGGGDMPYKVEPDLSNVTETVIEI